MNFLEEISTYLFVNTMNIFEAKEKNNIFHKMWREIYLLLFFNIGLLFGNITFFLIII